MTDYAATFFLRRFWLIAHRFPARDARYAVCSRSKKKKSGRESRHFFFFLYKIIMLLDLKTYRQVFKLQVLSHNKNKIKIKTVYLNLALCAFQVENIIK